MGAKLYIVVLSGTLAALHLGAAAADIYSYRDKNGVVHYTDRKSVNVKEKYTVAVRTRYAYHERKVDKLILKSSYDTIIRDAALKNRIDAALVRAVIHVESAFNPKAFSVAGATGLMQLMPSTASRYKVYNSFDPLQNIHGGTKYLSDLIKRFNNNERLAVAAYNAGENAVDRYKGIPPYPETTAYVELVMDLKKRYQSKTTGDS